MKYAWLVVTMLIVAVGVCSAQTKKKAADKDKEKEAAPVVPPKVIRGYRAGQWGMSQVAVMERKDGYWRHQDVQQEPDYVLQLGLPDEVKKLVPEDGKLPRRAPFRNFEVMLEVEAAECKVVYYFYEDKLYMIWSKEPCLRQIVKYKDWKAQMLETFGATTSEKPDGTLVWDQDMTFCQVTPNFVTSGKHTDDTLLDTFTVFLYDKRKKKEIIDWIKKNMQPE